MLLLLRCGLIGLNVRFSIWLQRLVVMNALPKIFFFFFVVELKAGAVQNILNQPVNSGQANLSSTQDQVTSRKYIRSSL